MRPRKVTPARRSCYGLSVLLVGGLAKISGHSHGDLLTVGDLTQFDRRALTELLVDKIIIERHPSFRHLRW